MEYKVKAKPNATRVEIASWIHELLMQHSSNVVKALRMADDLRAGIAQRMYLTAEEVTRGDQLLDFEEVQYVDPHAAYRAEQQSYATMRDAGAAGDAGAAIAYCKLEAEGKINHQGMC